MITLGAGAGVLPSILHTLLVTKSFCPFPVHPTLVSAGEIFLAIPTNIISQPSQPAPTNLFLVVDELFCV